MERQEAVVEQQTISRQVARRLMVAASTTKYVTYDVVEIAKGVFGTVGTPVPIPRDMLSRQDRRKLGRAKAAGEWRKHATRSQAS